jgi:hypothetical protein
MPAYERAALLRRAAGLIERDVKGLADLLTRETGKAIKDSEGEIRRSLETVLLAAEAAIPVVVPTARTDRRIRDADAVVSIRAAGIFVKGKSATDDDGSPLAVPPGTRLHRKARIVRDDPDGFVPVLPAGVDRENALLALARLEEIHEDGSRDVIYEGTLVPRDSPFVAVHPHMFVMPIPE